jgi:hypothetical protein
MLVAVALVLVAMMAVAASNAFAEEVPPPDEGFCEPRIERSAQGYLVAEANQPEIPDDASDRASNLLCRNQ